MNLIKIFAIPNKQEVELLAKNWADGLNAKGNELRSELGKGVQEGNLLHSIFDGVTKVDRDYVYYNTKVYVNKLEDIKDAKSKLKDLTGKFAIIPEKKSVLSFLDYKDSKSSIKSPHSGEEVEFTLREYFLNGRICAAAILSAINEHSDYFEGE